MYMLKSAGDRRQPCLTPLSTENQSDSLSLTRTLLRTLEYIAFREPKKGPCTPKPSTFCHWYSRRTESKALRRSIKAAKVDFPQAFLDSTIEVKVKRWSWVHRPFLKPFCSSASRLLSSSQQFSLRFRILEYAFKTTDWRQMPR